MAIALWVAGQSVFIGRLLTARVVAAGLALLGAGLLGGGCVDRSSASGPGKQLMVASRTDVAIALRTGRPQPTPLGGTYIGDIIAVTGYDFAEEATDNTVTIGGVACPVLGSVLLNPDHAFGPFRALYVEVRSDVPAGPGQVVEVSRLAPPEPEPQPEHEPGVPAAVPPAPATALERVYPSAATTVAVHRLAFATAAQGNVVHAVDVTTSPPAWISPRDLGVSAPSSAVTVSPDGRFVLFANGADLRISAIADGSTVLNATNFFGGPVGPMAVSADGRQLAAGVFPAGQPPQVVLADIGWLTTYNFNVIAGTGLLVPGITAPPAPARVAVGMGGAFPGGVAFNAAGTQLYITLSTGVVHVLNVAPQSIPSFSHQLAMPPGAAPFGLALTPDDRLALVTEIAFGLLVPVETADGATHAALLAGAQPIGPVIVPSGAHALVADAAGSALRVFHTATNTVQSTQPTLSLGFTPGTLAVSAEGAGGTAGRNLAVLTDGNRLRFVEVHGGTGALTLSTAVTGPFPNGLRLLAVTPSR
jgi:DNA-binding beta-propeller fold protein YncE